MLLEQARWVLVTVAAAVALPGPSASAPAEAHPEDAELAETARVVLRADYRNDRDELARQARALSARRPQRNRAWWAYWAGFASWRRGMNAYYQTPRPADLAADFERCAEQERAALVLDPGLDDARGALAGCLMGQAFAGPEVPAERRAALMRESLEHIATIERTAGEHPRSLWMVGGRLMAPPQQGGDLALARATFLRGLAAARAEALGPERPPWEPAWGAPENLMSLAFLHTLPPAPDREVARAYAEGALALVPDWHFVRDILLPRIEKLPGRPAASAAPPAAPPATAR
jgi:hypothetical protein